ncbi:hypothetical protein KIN20_026953 [Parelaphostrongylus tenuis]|uniref:SERTA domain-containing protein n=1 Tax=Parelaphostrongylus tenuis TaxID=148309 RepID=A0AAD5WDB7_PARTN|nr:hypothetical protein KIN20_026953 [Parelaphostrongylus tenuis]
MVLCASYNLRAHSTMLPPHAGEDCRYELTTTAATCVPSHFLASKPISLRSPCGTVDGSDLSPLSSSADSIGSVKSSSSSRSSAEREIERQQRRQLLDASLLKMRASNNMPLRKHLLVCNIVKQLQRDLDLLDDEELYCNLMDESYGERMDVDERRWPFGGATSTTTTTTSAVTSPACAVSIPVSAQVAPPQQEERRVAEDSTSLISKDLDMDLSKVVQQQPQEPQTTPLEMWSWGVDTTMSGNDRTTSDSDYDIFESIQAAVDESLFAWSWTVGGGPHINIDSWWTERARATSFDAAASHFEPDWRMGADPLGTTNLSRFELQHLFPSQVLLQA